MLRLVIAVAVAACVTAEESGWVWGKNQRTQRAFNNDEGDNYGNSFYGREKDREPTTRRPSTGQANDEDFSNPDDLRNYNGQSNFGYPPLGSGPGVGNNFPPGYGAAPGAINPQNFQNNGYPGPSAPGQSNYPSAPSGFGGGYPTAGGYPSAPGSGYPTQGGYPNQGGYPPAGPFPSGPSAGGYPGFPGYPGLGNIFAPGGGYPLQGGYPGQGPIGGQALAPNIANQGGGYPGYGVAPYPTQGGGYPNQPAYTTQPGYPGQYPGGNNYPPQGGQYPTGQYVGQLGQYPAPYPGQYPSPYPGQYPSGQYPYPDPYASYNPNNPYGITPYNKAGGYASAFDDYDEMSKNATNGSTRALKPEGKSLNVNSSASSSLDDKLRKIKKS